MQACTVAAGQTRRSHSQVEHHSAIYPTIAAGGDKEDQPSKQELHQQQHCPQCEQHSETPSRQPRSETTEKPIQRSKVKWPKTSDKDAWRSFKDSLYVTLQNTLRGSITSKLNVFGHIICEEGKERFGEMPQKRISPKQRGRQAWEIH